MSPVRRLWVGHSHDGRRVTLDVGGPGSRVLLLGSRAGDLASLIAFSAKEAGAAPIVLDFDGSVANSMSGYLDTYDYRSFLYDSFKLEEPEPWHSQMAAAAYTLALDLSTEEESIINSAMQVVASEGTLLSPVSLHDVLGQVEGFRGFYVDKLRGRIGALRLFDAVDDEDFQRLVSGNLIVDFHNAPYPQAAELAAALFIAKLLAVAHSRRPPDCLLIITEAHRVFRASPRAAHTNRLLTHLLSLQSTIVMASGQRQLLAPLLSESCPVVVYSSEAWYSRTGRAQAVLAGSLVLRDERSGCGEFFVQRRVPIKTSEYVRSKSGRFPAPSLAKRVLEEVDRFPISTPASLTQYISPEFLPADVASTLASLEKQGCLLLEPKDSGSGPRVFAYTLTEKGRRVLEELGG